MIWIWLAKLMVLAMRLLLPPRKGTRPAWIDRNARCPACGGRKGSILFERVDDKAKVRHLCEICKCAWYEDPVGSTKDPAV